MKLESSDEPPWLMNGSVTPVRGSRRVTPPTMRNAWNERDATRPTAVNALMSLLARAAVVRPRTASSMNSSSVSPRDRNTDTHTSTDWSFSAGTWASSHWSSLEGWVFSSSG